MSTRNNTLTGSKSPLLCYVTDRLSLGLAKPGESLTTLVRKIEEIAATGVDWIQIREKDLQARELASLVRESLRLTAKHSATTGFATRILVNDRLDVAIAERAGGVHLGEKSLPVKEAKRLIQSAVRQRSVDESFLVGVSCHSLESAKTAEQQGADYVFFGPVFATPSKQTFGAPQGVKRLEQICGAISIPVLAIGGIAQETIKPCLTAGASGVAAIRLFQDAVKPKYLVDSLRRITCP